MSVRVGKIFVYCDEGVSGFCYSQTVQMLRRVTGRDVDSVHSGDILSGRLAREECAVLVFPGGRDIPYDRKLG